LTPGVPCFFSITPQLFLRQIMTSPVLSVIAIVAVMAGFPVPAHATQAHGGIEGVVVHQMAHIVFVGAMALLIYWLRQHRLVLHPGWRRIQYAAIFFLLWNANAFIVHFLEEQVDILDLAQIGPWRLRILAQPAFEWAAWLYYVVKLDHLLCVPAMVCLYGGLKRLLETPSQGTQEGDGA
jgi:hypothetical protein